ncbi:MAG: hypothetical protein Q4F06_02090 [Eubacteriales bacterium]|nr:hypothetical protein [Eubacteriales bacterium]
MAENMMGDIIADHRERMLNLKKYYPFFKLIDISFGQYKEGRYEILDMGYIVMAILRFFIEENNFKEKDVTYPEYLEFLNQLLSRDFGLNLSDEENKDIADYIFDKIKNEGRPFEFSYFDPVEKKKRVSRMKIIESSIRENVVWYSISSDAIEFYLDTKEIKDESKINVSQLLLEKMINSQNFKGGVEVVERINEEVSRLKLKKNEVLTILAGDVFAGIEAYEEFVRTGMKWFEDEERLFKKNTDLIAKAIEKLEGSTVATEGYYKTVSEIHNLENQLKVAMNRHSELLRDCTDMQKMTDEAVRKAKLGRLRNHMDFTTTLSDMIKLDNADALVYLLNPLFKPNIRKTFNVTVIDEALTVKPERYEKKEQVSTDKPEEIVFDDEIEDKRIRDNYIFVMNNLLECLKKSDTITLKRFNELMSKAYGESILRNGDYYSFFVNLCQKNEYVIGGDGMKSDSFLDDILEAGFAGKDRVTFSINKMGDDRIQISENIEVTNVEFAVV